MLTRLKFRKNYGLVVRCLSDKTPDNEDKIPKHKADNVDDNKKSEKSITNTDKIQELLKNMMQESKIKDEEYRAKFATAPIIPRKRKPKSDEIDVKIEQIEESITTAAEDVAQALGGDVKQTEAELLSRVLGKINQTSTTLSDLLMGMKVDRTQEQGEERRTPSRGDQVKRLAGRHQSASSEIRYSQRKEQQQMNRDFRERKSVAQVRQINVLSEKPLGIFTKRDVPNYGTRLGVWESLQNRELDLATLQAPSNYFQKMIQWTDQGKVWKFPINNEQGLEEEEKIHFSEHIFLDTHIEGWCPSKGPVRHFMELVCVGLSKNPFYTIQEKKDHIMWYKEYFESKKDILTEVGAWELTPKPSQPESSN